MSRRDSLRISKQEKEELQRLNKNVNNKKSRIRTKYGVEVQEISTKRINDFSTRTEVNEYKDRMRSFTNRYNTNYQYVQNEKGVTFTKRERNEAKRIERRINRIKTNERKRLANEVFKDRGVPTELTVQQQQYKMGDPRYSDTKNVKLDLNRYENRKDFIREKERLKEVYKGDFISRRAKIYKTNYLTAITNVFEGMGDSRLKPLRDKINSMTPQELADLSRTENLGKLDFIYDPLRMETKLRNIETAFGI